ncbi:MAG: trimethylamine methyltransferase family protein [Candidatus Jordarchaeaceae archaeon]
MNVSRPSLSFLERDTIKNIYDSALRILESTGVEIDNLEVLEVLHQSGAVIDFDKRIAKFPQDLVKKCVKLAPSEIKLYSRDGKHDLLLKNNNVYFNPGSAAITLLENGIIRKPLSEDLVKFVRVTDYLKYIHAQSTALVITDVPERFVDRYRLYIVLKNSTKPVITGAFTKDGVHEMKKMLEIIMDKSDLKKKTRSYF